jgi:hypothetical protein
MIDQVKRAIAEIEKLPAEKQSEIAQLIQDELGWDKTFTDTQDELTTLAKEALSEYKAKKTSSSKW